MSALTMPVSHADPFSPELLEDPHGFHADLRDAGEVVHLAAYGVYGMGRYDSVHAALVNWQEFVSGAGVGLSDFRKEKPWRPPSVLLEADPPRHDAPRAVLTKILSTRALRRLRELWFDDADRLVQEVLARGEIDAVTELAEVFPLRVFPDAVGLGPDGRENLLPYGTFAFNAFGPRNALVEAGLPEIPRISGWVGEQCLRERLSADGFGAQIWAAADRGDITHDQAPLIVRSLLTAGVDTTVNGLSAALYSFASAPEQFALLREQPGLARVAFEEAVRFESPVQTFFRTAEQDVRLGDVTVPEGEKILMFLGSANRDPRRWERPDEFDITRDPSGHVGFGMGLHQCAGQHVARLEAEAVLTALARHVGRIEIVGAPERRHNNTLRAWAHLPVRLHPA